MRTDAEIEAAARTETELEWVGSIETEFGEHPYSRRHSLRVLLGRAIAVIAPSMVLHLMTLDNFLGGQGGVSGAADAREALEQITDYLAEAGSVAPSSVPAERFEMRRVAGENAEIARLRRDCAELYQVIGVLAGPHADLNGRPVLKVLNNALAAANGQPRPHDDLLPFTLPAPGGSTTPYDAMIETIGAEMDEPEECTLIERLEKWAEYIGRSQTTIYDDADGDAVKITEDLEKGAAALTSAKALADAVAEWAQPMSLCDPHVGEVARVRAEKLRAALAAFRAAGG